MTREPVEAMQGVVVTAPSAAPRLSRALRALRDGLVANAALPTEKGRGDRTETPAPIDTDDLRQRLRGRRDLIVKTLSLFHGECERGVDELRREIDRGDLAMAATVAHRIKGAAATASAHAVRDAAGMVENGCRGGRADEVIAGFMELERAASQAAARLTQELARLKASPLPGGPEM